MATVIIERLDDTGLKFRVHLDQKLLQRATKAFHNGELYKDFLTGAGRSIYERLEVLPGIDREIMISTYSFETGISYAFNPQEVMRKVFEILAEVLKEKIELRCSPDFDSLAEDRPKFLLLEGISQSS